MTDAPSHRPSGAYWRRRRAAEMPPDLVEALERRKQIRAEEAKADRERIHAAQVAAGKRVSAINQLDWINQSCRKRLAKIEANPHPIMRAAMLGRMADWLASEQERIAKATAILKGGTGN